MGKHGFYESRASDRSGFGNWFRTWSRPSDRLQNMVFTSQELLTGSKTLFFTSQDLLTDLVWGWFGVGFGFGLGLVWVWSGVGSGKKNDLL